VLEDEASHHRVEALPELGGGEVPFEELDVLQAGLSGAPSGNGHHQRIPVHAQNAAALSDELGGEQGHVPGA
jgi:hypothetical protein